MKLNFGVVTPTFRRPRLLRRFYRNLAAQTHANWQWAIVHDGPTASAFTEAVGQLSRTTSLSTPAKTDNYGATGRWWGARHFCRAENPPDYLVFWDDDDQFFTAALSEIERALERHGFPDVLLVPFEAQGKFLPRGASSVSEFREKELTTANLVMRPDVARRAYEQVVASGVKRATDYHAFAAAKSFSGVTVRVARDLAPIGKADGLRRLPAVLERLGLPASLAWPFHRHRLVSALKHQLVSWIGAKQKARRFVERVYDVRKGFRRRATVAVAGVGDGRWCYAPQALDKNSVVYSVGIGEDISFDLDLIRRYGCSVHAFDPTLRSQRWLARQPLPPAFRTYPWGVAHFDGSAEFRLPASHSVSFSLCAEGESIAEHRAEVRRISTLMELLGHAHLDLLKLDVEGAEYEVIDDLVAAAPRIRQLLIEFHERLRPSGEGKLTRAAVEKLRNAGYRVIHVSRRGWEYTFVR